MKKHLSYLMVILLLMSSLSACNKAAREARKSKRNKTSKTANLPKPPVEKPTPTTPEPPVPDEPPIELTYNFETAETVKKAQILLFLSGYSPGRIDGQMKEETVLALEQFQANQGVTVGDRTAKSLDAIGVNLMDFEVKDIQSALEKKGFDPGPIDNLVGNMTRSAFTDFINGNELKFGQFTPNLKAALFSTDEKYNNKQEEDALFFEDPNEPVTLPDVANLGAASSARIVDVKRALQSLGYDPGPMTNDMSPQMKDALFHFQVERELPLGGLNSDTLYSLGFR